jgi:hypothetical protein
MTVPQRKLVNFRTVFYLSDGSIKDRYEQYENIKFSNNGQNLYWTGTRGFNVMNASYSYPTGVYRELVITGNKREVVTKAECSSVETQQ